MSIETRQVTAKEFEAFIAQPAHTERHFELIHGEIIEDIPTEERSILAGNIYFHLRMFVTKHGLGRVAFEVRRKLPGDEHNVRLPDVDFTNTERLQERDDDEIVRSGPVPQLPDLAVEIQSPGQSDKLMVDKATYYLTSGTRMVWLVYPRKQLVEVITADDRVLLSDDDLLEGGAVIPGFSLRVADIFHTRAG